MFWWLKKLAKNPAGIGSVAPSGPSLAKLMTKDIAASAQVLELGPGEGAITSHILNRLATPEQLVLVEFDRELGEICRGKFAGVTVHHDDVESHLLSHHENYDHIVSGIPFAAMDKDKRRRVFMLIHERLNPGGRFTMFQYSTTTLKENRQIFGNAKIEFTPFNVPPAFVFTCTKK